MQSPEVVDQDLVEPNVHPVAEAIARRYAENEADLAVEDFDAIRSALLDLSEDPQLGPAVDSVVRMAAYLDKEQGKAELAQKLLDVAYDSIDALKRQAERFIETRQDMAEEKKKKLESFSAAEQQKRAPKVDDDKEGVPLSAVVPVPRRFKR